MAYQEYKSLDILRGQKKSFPCSFDGSGKSAALMRGDKNHQSCFSIDWDMDFCQYFQRIQKDEDVCN